MGSTLHWREPPERPADGLEMIVSFGHGRSAGGGFMAYSQRSGPGVLVICDPFEESTSGRTLARTLRDEGFTALLLDFGAGDLDSFGRIDAAARYLVDNWHPRLGIVCLSRGTEFAARLVEDRDVDAVVFYAPGDATRWDDRTPLLRHAPDDSRGGFEAAHERTFEFLRYYLS